MKTTRFTESQIVAVLNQSDAGLPIKDICRQARISQATYCQWKSKYGGIIHNQSVRLKIRNFCLKFIVRSMKAMAFMEVLTFILTCVMDPTNTRSARKMLLLRV